MTGHNELKHGKDLIGLVLNYCKKEDFLKSLLRAGAPLNVQSDLGAPNNHLTVALKNFHLRLAKKLAKQYGLGRLEKLRDSFTGNTALHIIIIHSEEICGQQWNVLMAWIKSFGIEILADKNHAGDTPLHLAADTGTTK